MKNNLKAIKNFLNKIVDGIVFGLRLLIEEYLKSYFSNISYTVYSQHFVYHSVIEESVRLGVNIKRIASNLTLPFLYTKQCSISANDINKCKLLLVLHNI